MAPPLSGYGQATYVLTHSLIQRPMAVTCGHNIAGFDTDYVEAANDLHQAFGSTIMAGMDSDVTLQYVDLLIGTTDDDPTGSVRSDNAPIPGGTAYSAPPANVAVLVTKNTATLGRRGRGRMFLPFYVAESAVDESGTIDSNVMDDFQGNFDAWLALLQAADPTLNPVLNSTNGPGTLQRVARQITGFRVENKVATQRRRLRR